MNLMDELFKDNNGDEMDFMKKIAVLSALSSMPSEKMWITAMGVEIKASPFGINVQSRGNKKLLEDLGLVDALKDFTEEINPIAEKYGNLVAERLNNFFGEELDKPDSHAKHLEEMLKTFFK